MSTLVSLRERLLERRLRSRRLLERRLRSRRGCGEGCGREPPVCSVDLRNRIEKKKRETVSIGDAMSVVMAPDEVMIVARIEGYADKPEAQ